MLNAFEKKILRLERGHHGGACMADKFSLGGKSQVWAGAGVGFSLLGRQISLKNGEKFAI